MRPGDLLRRFHEAARQPSRPAATRPPADEVRLRVRLVLEEALEAVEAMLGPEFMRRYAPWWEAFLADARILDGFIEHATGTPEDGLPGEGANLPAVAHELADLVFVTYGTAEHYGIDLDKALEIIADANMRKLPDCPAGCDGGYVRGERDGPGFPGAFRTYSEPCSTCGGTGKDPGRDRSAHKIAKPDGWEPPDLTWALRRVYRRPEDVPEVTKETAVGVDPETGGEKLIEREP